MTSTPDKNSLARGLIQLLDVAPAAPEGHFTGARKDGGVGRVFGGQVIGQALVAAAKTVPDDRLVHSLHCYFLRPGNDDHGIDFEVANDLDGRSFSNRRVVARQQGKPIFSMLTSFHRDEPGLAHALPMPDVPPPDALLSLGDLMRVHPFPAGPVLRRMATSPSPLEFRPIGSIQQGDPSDLAEPMTRCWVRVGEGALGVRQMVQRAVLAYASDLFLLGTAYRPHGLHIGAADVISASIDHSLWFHEDVECGDWLLYAMDSPFAGHARGFARGHFFSPDGRLIASVAQEGLMRLKEG
ncbi:MAG: acyl-CoA thioesterase II [Sphingomonadales bacterium]|nr:acyl-CoA thioesterase II [Sphingomonadales bacterium]